ncbi:hypothetical protein [Maricaulis parjimensis]|uniref:hypothetical protein n=1 Tax=Maricaulis parjimensis TaxID=144023 RepID=UPI00193AD02C|nr:hypothetical protein [Maricaulis parjimensis]
MAFDRIARTAVLATALATGLGLAAPVALADDQRLPSGEILEMDGNAGTCQLTFTADGQITASGGTTCEALWSGSWQAEPGIIAFYWAQYRTACPSWPEYETGQRFDLGGSADAFPTPPGVADARCWIDEYRSNATYLEVIEGAAD